MTKVCHVHVQGNHIATLRLPKNSLTLLLHPWHDPTLFEPRDLVCQCHSDGIFFEQGLHDILPTPVALWLLAITRGLTGEQC